MKETLKIYGDSAGDSSVGINSGHFEIDLGLYPEDADKETREFIRNRIIKAMYELHDNGTIYYSFSDEADDDYPRRYGYADIKRYNENQKVI